MRNYRYASALYFECYRIDPKVRGIAARCPLPALRSLRAGLGCEMNFIHQSTVVQEPLVCLGLSVSLFCYAQSRNCIDKHQEASRAWAFLAEYGALRRAQHDRVIPTSLPPVAAAEQREIRGTSTDSSAVASSGSHTGDGAQSLGSALSSSLASNATSASNLQSTSVPTPVSLTLSASRTTQRLPADWAPLPLPAFLVEREVWYNLGRAAHQLSLLGTAVDCYERCLAISVPEGSRNSAAVGADASAVSSVSSSAVQSSREALHTTTLNVQRDAAHNLVLILRGSGNEARALEVMMSHLCY